MTANEICHDWLLWWSPVASIRCGACGLAHSSVDAVRSCYAEQRRKNSLNRPPASGRNSLNRLSARRRRPAELDEIAEHGRAQVDPYPVERKDREAARRRAEPSIGEKCLAEALDRDGSVRYRREEPIVGYYVDFFFPDAYLIVEVLSRTYHEKRVKDGRRADVLRAAGYAYMEFWTDDILRNTGSIVKPIIRLVRPRQKQADARRRRGPAKPTARDVRTLRRETERLDAEARRDAGFDVKRRRRAAPIRKAEEHRQEAEKYRFRCATCRRRFFASAKPWPRCHACQDDSAVLSVCSGDQCRTEFPGRELARFCGRCVGGRNDIRDSRRGGLSEYWKRGRHSRGT